MPWTSWALVSLVLLHLAPKGASKPLKDAAAVPQTGAIPSSSRVSMGKDSF